MEKKQEDKQTTKPATKTETNGKEQTPKRRTNKTWEAFGRLKGSFTVYDPNLML